MSTKENNYFSKNLAKKLKEKHLSQKKLADSVGISEPTMAFYINGKRQPNIGTAVKIANSLNCSVGELIGEKNALRQMYKNQEYLSISSMYGILNDRGKKQFLESIENITYNPKNIDLSGRDKIVSAIKELENIIN